MSEHTHSRQPWPRPPYTPKVRAPYGFRRAMQRRDAMARRRERERIRERVRRARRRVLLSIVDRCEFDDDDPESAAAAYTHMDADVRSMYEAATDAVLGIIEDAIKGE